MAEVKTYLSLRGKTRTIQRNKRGEDGKIISKPPINFIDGRCSTSDAAMQKEIESHPDYGSGIIPLSDKGFKGKRPVVETPQQKRAKMELQMQQAIKDGTITPGKGNKLRVKTGKAEAQKTDDKTEDNPDGRDDNSFPGIDKVQPAQDKLLELGLIESVADARSRKAVHEVADKAGISFPDLLRE